MRRQAEKVGQDPVLAEWASLSSLMWPILKESRVLRELQDEMSEWRTARALLGGEELPGEALCRVLIDRMRERHERRDFRILQCLAAFPLRGNGTPGPAMRLLEKW